LPKSAKNRKKGQKSTFFGFGRKFMKIAYCVLRLFLALAFAYCGLRIFYLGRNCVLRQRENQLRPSLPVIMPPGHYAPGHYAPQYPKYA